MAAPESGWVSVDSSRVGATGDRRDLKRNSDPDLDTSVNALARAQIRRFALSPIAHA
jgi:hypothetical protein